MSQGVVKKSRGVKFYALLISVCVHAGALLIFAAVKITQAAPAPLQTTAVVSISQVRQLTQSPVVMPKPKVINDSRSIVRAKGITPSNPKLQNQNTKQITNSNRQSITSSDIHCEPAALPMMSGIPSAQAEFFGSTAQGRRICYVVDCSGSMQGLWQRVRGGLFESIGQLQPDQYFCVIVFGAGSVLESSGGKMVRATEQAKKDAYSFIDSLRPAGTTNALAAIQQAIKIRDKTGVGPSLIYFLTDGFELSEQDNSRFAHEVMTMLRSFSPKTRINAIGFWPAEQDRRLLETMARESGGEFVIVGDSGS